MAELGGLLGGGGDDRKDEYVPVEWLDYTFIENCNDEKKLRQIIDKLASGQEGYYPELLKAGEEKLLSVVSPAEKNRILRLRQKTTPEEIDQAEKDLSDWQNVIINTDKKLRDESIALPIEEDNGDIFTSKINKDSKLPPVRGSATDVKVVKNTITTKSTTVKSDKKEKEARLSGYNFGAWEKFNVDDAIDKIDEDDNKREKALTDMQAKYSTMEEDQKKRREQIRQKEKEKILNDLNANELSELQRKNRAVREKQKGNECFKIGENDEAFNCYSRSIALDGSSAIVYANRAMTSIKLDRYEIAEDDCTMSLRLDKNYVKAWMRRGMTRFKQGKYALSAGDFWKACQLDPNNTELGKLLENSKLKYLDSEGKELVFDEEGNPKARAVVKEVPKTKTKKVSNVTQVKIGNDEVEVDINYQNVNSFESLMLPSISSIRQIFHGKYDTIVEPASSSSGFTRVAITDNSDSESESDEEEKGENKSWSSTRVQIVDEDEEDNYEQVLEEPLLSSTTRITISEDDSDSDVDDVSSTPKPYIASPTFIGSKQGYYFKKGDLGIGYYLDKFQNPPEVVKKVTKAFDDVKPIANTTRIAISEDDSDSDEEENDKELALQLKEKGNALYKEKDYEGSIKCYSDSLLKDPTLISSANNRAMSYIALKKYNETIIDCNFVIKAEPKNIKALYRRALSMFEIDKLDNSSSDIKMILSIDPNNAQAIALNNEIIKKATTENVIDDCNYELTIKKLKEKAQYELASGDAKSALETLTNALKLVKFIDGHDKNDSIPLLSMICTSQSVLGNYSSVVENCTIILGIDTKNFKSLIRRADALIKMNNIEDAKADVLTAIRIDPTNTEAMGLLDEISHLETKAKSLIIDKKSDSISLKEKGNEAMKTQSFNEAVSCYTKSIETDPTNLVSYGNRSQAYLKLSRFADAEKDATYVLNNSDDVALKQKSLFRRSLARRGLGGKHLKSSLADIDEAISQDRDNKLFIAERTKTLALYKESEASLARKNSTAVKSSSKISSKPSVVSDSSFALKEVATTIKKKVIETPPIDEETITPILAEQVASPKKVINKVTETSIRKPIVIPISDIPIPTEPPKTVYELERIWRGMKDRPDIFANYLAIFKKSNYKKCFKESVSPDLFSSLLISLRDHAPIKVITTALDGISQIPSFNMMVSLLPEEDINVLKVVIDKVAENKGSDSEIVIQLKQSYKV